MTEDIDKYTKTIEAAFQAAKNSKLESNFSFYIFQTEVEKFLSMAHAIEHMADEVALFSSKCSEKFQKRLSKIHWHLCSIRCDMLDVVDIAEVTNREDKQ